MLKINTLSENYRIGIILAVISSIGLGIVGIIDKIGISQVANPLIFSIHSLFFGMLFTFIFMLIYLKKTVIANLKSISLSSWGLLILVGICSSGLSILFRFIGLRQSTGTFATLSQIIATSLTAILVYIFLKERLSKNFWLLFLTIICATYFVSIGKITLATLKMGDSFILLGTLFLALGNIFSKIAVKDTLPVVLSAGRFFFGFIFTVLVGIFFFKSNLNIYPFSIWGALSGILWASNILSFNMAIKRIGVTFTTSLLMVAPIYTMILEYLLLKHVFTSVQVVAALIVIVSGLLMILTKK